MDKQKPTLHDVAAVCGVNVTTVSRALKDDPRVREETRRRISMAAADVGYRPNIAARMLKEGHSRLLWMIVPTLGTMVDQRIAERASLTAAAENYDLAISVHHGRQNDFDRLIDVIGFSLGAGVIINRRDIRDISRVRPLIESRFPVIFIDVPALSLNAGLVTTDHERASAALVERVVQLGARQILLLMKRETNRVEERRIEGATRAAAHCGANIVTMENQQQLWKEITKQGGPVALMASSSETINDFYRQWAADDTPTERPFAVCFDKWDGELAPFSRVLVAEQDYEAMADAAVEDTLAMIRQGKALLGKLFPIREIKEFSSAMSLL